MTDTTPRLLLSAREASHALGISERKLWGMTKRGEVPCVRLGKRVLYSIADLEDYIAAHKTGGAA